MRDFPGEQRRRARLHLAAAAALYALAVVWLSWPLVTSPAASVVDPLRLPRAGGVWGRADLDLLMWILAWTAHALGSAPATVFQANIFHPARDTLASSEHLLGLAPLAAPLFWATGNAVLTYNVTVLVVVWLAALCTFALVRAWTGCFAAALLAGAAFALGPELTGSWIRLHGSAVHFFPLVLLLAWRAVRAPRAATLLLLAVVTGLQLLAGVYVAFELAVLLAAFAPALVVEAQRRGTGVLRPFAAIGAGALALAVIAPAYLRVRASGTFPALAEAVALVADTAPPLPVVLGWIVADATWPVVALALFGLARSRRVGVHLRLGVLAVAAVGIVLSAGTTLPLLPGTNLPSLYELAMRFVPGFAGMRASARFTVLPLLATAVLAGIGAAELAELLSARLRARGEPLAGRAALATSLVLGVATLALVAARAPAGALPLVRVPLGGLRNAAYLWLRDRAEPGPVLELPVMNSGMDGGAILATGRYMLGSTLHFLPLLNGYSGHPPAASVLLMTLAQRLPDADAFAEICALAAPRWIVVHLGLAPGSEATWAAAAPRLGLVPAARFGHDVVYDAGEACAAAARRAGERAIDPPQGRTHAGTALALLGARDARASLSGELPRALPPGAHGWLWLEVRNDGGAVFPGLAARAPGVVELRTRWRDARDGAVVAESPPVPLARDLAPGESVRAQASYDAPRSPGRYVLEAGIVQRGAGWLADGPDPDAILRGETTVAAAVETDQSSRAATAGTRRNAETPIR